MKKKIKNTLLGLGLALSLSVNALAQSQAVISIGSDLNQEQRSQMMTIFAADKDDRVIEVSNQEERKYLGQYVSSKLLGSRAISSSYVKPLKKGEGIRVETYNISWVSEDMLISALATAGVKDAYVKVAAPFNVSGTAALTGVIKGFEGATGEYIGEEEKQVASQEIATAGELGESIGKEEASQIINRVKEEVVKNKLDDPEEIKKIIERAAQEVEVKLTEEQKEKIVGLMEKISNLDLNVEDIKGQLKNISEGLKKLEESSKEIKSVLGKILDFIGRIFDKLSDLFK